MKLSNKISILFLIGTVIAVVLQGSLGFYLVKSALTKSINDNHGLMTGVALREMERFLFERYSDTREIASRPLLEDYLSGKSQMDTVEFFNRLLVTTGPWNELVLIDKNGKTLADTNEFLSQSSDDTILDDERNKAWQSAMAGNVYYSDAFISPEFKMPTIIFAAPVRENATDDTINGVVIAELAWPAILEILESYKDFSFYLFNRSGLLVGTDNQEWKDKIFSQAIKDEKIFQHYLSSEQHVEQGGLVYQDEDLLVACVKEIGYLSYLGNGWTLIFTSPISQVLSSATSTAVSLVLALILIIILASSSFLLGGIKYVVNPIAALYKSTQIVSGGNLDYRVPVVGDDEISRLGVAYNEMLDKLKSARANLEEKVKARTLELDKKVIIIETNNKDLQATQKAMVNLMEDLNVEKNNIAQEKTKIELIVKSIGDGVLVVDQNYKIIIFNAIAAKISGFSASEAVGKKFNDILKFIREEDEKINDQFIAEAISSGEIKNMSNHTLLIKKDGSKVPVADSAAPLKNEKGEVVGCVVVFRDVTKEREIDRMKSEFVAVTSHQLRTPLTGIKWFAELLLKDKKHKMAKEQKDFIQQISVSNERLIRLVDDLLDVSHIETGRKYTVVLKPESLHDLVKEVVDGQMLSAKKKNIKITCPTCKEKLITPIDREKIRQVFANLISNAIKYSPAKSVIELGREIKKNEIVISIKDHGVGIPQHQQTRIFEKFFRADNVATTESGTGLGLYIAKAIIEGHGGRLWFESPSSVSPGGTTAGKKEKQPARQSPDGSSRMAGGGTTFYVALPLINK